MGTANVMALELGIRSTLQATSRMLFGRSRAFTAGRLQNDIRKSRFFLMAGAGFDGHIVRGVSLREKRLLGKSAYLLSALRSIVSWDSSELQVTTETEQFSCGSLIISNTARYGGPFSLSPSANIFSQSFELTAIKGSSRSAAIRAMTDVVLGRSESVELYKTTASRIIVTGFKPVQADGDNWGNSPVEIVAEPDYAKLLI
jgi:diacylglycerol kinase family enzyme